MPCLTLRTQNQKKIPIILEKIEFYFLCKQASKRIRYTTLVFGQT